MNGFDWFMFGAASVVAFQLAAGALSRWRSTDPVHELDGVPPLVRYDGRADR